MVYLQGIIMPLIFLLRFRLGLCASWEAYELANRKKRLMEHRIIITNTRIGDDLIAAYDREITKGWWYLTPLQPFVHMVPRSCVFLFANECTHIESICVSDTKNNEYYHHFSVTRIHKEYCNEQAHIYFNYRMLYTMIGKHETFCISLVFSSR